MINRIEKASAEAQMPGLFLIWDNGRLKENFHEYNMTMKYFLCFGENGG
jgi:hypothetical protein